MRAEESFRDREKSHRLNQFSASCGISTFPCVCMLVHVCACMCVCVLLTHPLRVKNGPKLVTSSFPVLPTLSTTKAP